MTVQAKVQMLDNLLDIEVAYSLLRGGAQDNDNDPIDINYEKLKTQIEVCSSDHYWTSVDYLKKKKKTRSVLRFC